MASRYWIKFYIEVLDDPKMGRLPDRLWRRACELFLVAGETHDNGSLPSLEDLAWRLRLTSEELSEDLSQLTELGILKCNDGGWHVINFSPRCDPRPNYSFWAKLRQKIFSRDRHTCRYCGGNAEHVDHVIPRVQGGNDVPENLVASCAPCNYRKGGRTPEQAGMRLADAPLS